MQIDLDARGRKVVIFGDLATTRQAVRRFLHAEGTVTLVLDGPLPDYPDRIDTVRYARRPALTGPCGRRHAPPGAVWTAGRLPRPNRHGSLCPPTGADRHGWVTPADRTRLVDR